MISEQLQIKIDRAIKFLKSVEPTDGTPIELCYSGGKDSDVILQLAKEAGINYRAIYKNTTIDPIGTIQHVREMGVEVRNPKMSFFNLVAKKGYPSRFVRFCCSELKEYKILDKAIVGVRKCESKERKERYTEPTQCRFYGSKKEHVEQVLPILDWTDEDVKEFIIDRGIKCAPIYYDENGNFHIDRRLGCIGCPIQSRNKRKEELKNNPRMVKSWIKFGQKYLDTHPNVKASQNFANSYEFFHYTLFYESLQEFKDKTNGIFGKVDSKQFLEQYFGVQLD